MTESRMVPVQSITELQPGDIIRHKGGAEALIVTANYGGRVTAVRTADVTNPIEWLVMRDVPVSEESE